MSRYMTGFILVLMLAVPVLMAAGTVSAVDVINCDDPDLAQSIACSGSDADPDENPVIRIILNVVELFLYATIIATVIMVIVSGIRYILSGGNQQTLATAKNTIKYALIGMVLALLAAVMINILVDVIFPEPQPVEIPEPPETGVPI